jgi:hypothetical protein
MMAGGEVRGLLSRDLLVLCVIVIIFLTGHVLPYLRFRFRIVRYFQYSKKRNLRKAHGVQLLGLNFTVYFRRTHEQQHVPQINCGYSRDNSERNPEKGYHQRHFLRVPDGASEDYRAVDVATANRD